MSLVQVTGWKWLRSGDEAFAAMLAAIEAAQEAVRLEPYIFSDDELGRRFRDALIRTDPGRSNDTPSAPHPRTR